MFDTRIRLDDPIIGHLQALPTYYVGQCIIADGFEETFGYVESCAESDRLTEWHHEVVRVLREYFMLNAHVEQGDSPGSNTNVKVIFPPAPGRNDWEYLFVGLYSGTEGGLSGTDYARQYIQGYDEMGNPIGDPTRITENDPAIVARHVSHVVEATWAWVNRCG